MGDINHLAKFQEGARAWNAWRAECPGITPDLRNLVCNLGQKQLGPANGGPINLNDALLNGAKLHSANLFEAQLSNADLRQANLSMALLSRADLSYSNLSGAILDHADLGSASLEGAMLEGARLDQARNLTQAQIDTALGDAHTTLPPDLEMPKAWRAWEQFTDGDLLHNDDEDFFDAMPHEVLGLGLKANADEIRAAYLKLAKKYHPDVNPGDLIAERRFKKINEAYHLLTAPEAKRPKRRTSPWAAASVLFAFAFAGPSLAVYWFAMSPLKEAEPQLLVQTERIEKSSDRLAAPPPEPATPALNGTEYTGALPNPAPEASDKPETAAAEIPPPDTAGREEQHAAMLQETEAQHIKTAGEVQIAMGILPDERQTAGTLVPGSTPLGALIAGAVKANSMPDRVVPAPDASAPAPQRMASLQPALPTPAETGSAPWDEEWAKLQGSNELLPLHSFIQRYRETPVADDARGRFRAVVAGLENADELKKFVRETVDDSPERMVVKRQLAMLVEKETAEGDQRAWDQARERGTVAALRAYLLGYPNGKFTYKAEDRLAALEEVASGRKKDSAAWAKALRTATRAGYETYLKAEPDGRYVDDARRKIAALTNQESSARKEEEAWAKASKERTRSAYYSYLNAYPNGRFASAAQEAVEKTDRPAPPLAVAERAPSDTSHVRRRNGPRWPSSDEPFVERIEGAR